jgi:PKD repeat protein
LTRLALLPLAATLLAAACDKVPLTAPTESTIQLFAAATSVSPTGSTDIIATVTESSGTAVQNGTVVSFTTTLGRLEPSEARTSNGKVTVKFTADGRSGTARITAFSGGAATEEPLELPIGSAAAETITLRAEPARLPANGGSTQIIALARDLAGNNMPGVSVAFSATAGTLTPGVATTDANGEARSTLTSGRETTVTATVGSKTATLTLSVDVAPSVTITPPPTIVEEQPAAFTLTVSASSGALPITQAHIDFGDGTSQSLGALPVGTTSVSHIYGSDGTFTVTLTLTDSSGAVSTQRTVVVVTPAVPIGVSLTYSPAAPAVNQAVTFTAATTVPTGVSIERYRWTFGDGTSSETTGNTRTKIYTSAGTRKVRVVVTATNGQTGSAEADIVISP